MACDFLDCDHHKRVARSGLRPCLFNGAHVITQIFLYTLAILYGIGMMSGWVALSLFGGVLLAIGILALIDLF